MTTVNHRDTEARRTHRDLLGPAGCTPPLGIIRAQTKPFFVRPPCLCVPVVNVRHQAGQSAGTRRTIRPGIVERDVEQAVGAGDDVADTAKPLEDRLLMRHCMAVDGQAPQLASGEHRDKQIVLPSRETDRRCRRRSR